MSRSWCEWLVNAPDVPGQSGFSSERVHSLYFRRFLAAHAAIIPQVFRVSTICCNSARSAELVLNTVSRVTLRST